MATEQTTYTHLRENLASHLRKILKKNIVLEVIWRNHKTCVVMSKKHYDQLVKNGLPVGHVNVSDPLDGHGQIRSSATRTVHGHKKIEKIPPSLISEYQRDLFKQ